MLHIYYVPISPGWGEEEILKGRWSNRSVRPSGYRVNNSKMMP